MGLTGGIAMHELRPCESAEHSGRTQGKRTFARRVLFLVAVPALLLACGGGHTESDAPAAATGAGVPVKECQAYADRYERCMTRVDPTAKDVARRRADALRASLSLQAGEDPAVLASRCTAALAQLDCH
jgi:hypothetical protein